MATSAEATGRRKSSVCRARVRLGQGKVTINGQDPLAYLKRQVLVNLFESPMAATDTLGKLDIICKVSGGGLSGQAGAVSLAISRALLIIDPDLRPTLRSKGFLTRDAREVERKKYGQPKARKKFQFSKR
ncbi:30S ribosomal protein S9 [Gemmatimonas aurantiaca]|nr:30S ribosomal protein S9 [Gemmatimonas aurantiaca]